jgi:site-specific DNA-methyltransferase (adenine-specific)
LLELNRVYNMDCLDGMKLLDDNSVDSIVTDPPYELGFMGKKWDSTGIAYNVELWKECLRILKPGGHLLAFGGTRTYHRMACAIEDAGFEIRDQMQWIYGSGFPKSHDISKAIDKKLGAKREVIGKSDSKGIRSGSGNYVGDNYKQVGYDITIPATPEAKQWDGWGTALKPANEPIVLARKPISEKTIAENVMKWGTGALNIDGCRIGTEEIKTYGKRKGQGVSLEWSKYTSPEGYEGEIHQGRFPANVILDEEAGRMLDEQSGVTRSGKVKSDKGAYSGVSTTGFLRGITTTQNQHGDSGGASRFFYCAKASKKERGEGNNHPTVKPVKLMEYLITLITPPNGIVLDPFFGSGTTGIAAVNLGFHYIGFEIDKTYCDIAAKRISDITPEYCKMAEKRIKPYLMQPTLF